MSITEKEQNELTQHLREQLVTQMKETNAIRSTSIEDAFLTIPREAFIPAFYQRDDQERRMIWQHRTREHTNTKSYLKQIYRDESLVTKIDQSGWPISSSSQPSVMAKMLEALDVQPGQRVLEVGTGTGYNAALLSMLTGHPRHVVTIDYDPALTQAATVALAKVVGDRVSVVTGDGFLGHVEGGPYDRIMITASIPTIPMALIEQLHIGGKLVMDLQGPLASGFLVLTKHTTNTTGHFLNEPLHFMPLSSTKISKPGTPHVSDLERQHSFPLPPNHLFPGILDNGAFRWFLQWYIPGCQIIRKKKQSHDTAMPATIITVINPDAQRQSIVQFTGETEWHVTTYGSENLWNELMSVFDIFTSLGKPQASEYQLVITDMVAMLTIQTIELPV